MEAYTPWFKISTDTDTYKGIEQYVMVLSDVLQNIKEFTILHQENVNKSNTHVSYNLYLLNDNFICI